MSGSRYCPIAPPTPASPRAPASSLPGTPVPRRSAVAVRHRRGLAAPTRRHRHPARRRQHPVPRSPPPGSRPGRRPHPHRKDTGFGRFPSRLFAINQAWLQLALTGIDLLAWTQNLLLDGDLATAEPKKLRYRLLRRGPDHLYARRTRLAIAGGWPWTDALTSAFTALAALPRPTG